MTENTNSMSQASGDEEQAFVQAARERFARVREFETIAEAKFLASWKRGVKKMGDRFFNVQTATVDEATDKEQLRPNPIAINTEFAVLSHGEKVLLANMYCFFNADDGQALIDQLPDLKQAVDQFRVLDLAGREILRDLLFYDQGW